jgi:hypothetical protein
MTLDKIPEKDNFILVIGLFAKILKRNKNVIDLLIYEILGQDLNSDLIALIIIRGSSLRLTFIKIQQESNVDLTLDS